MEEILKNVKASMDDAEELGSGLTKPEYIQLMGMIAQEAMTRMMNAHTDKLPIGFRS